MKKAILATLVSAIAVAGTANAATTDVTAEVYGKVGVSYDSHDAQNADRTDEINALRNTEFGIRGQVANTEKVSVGYDLRADFDENEKAQLSRANITLGTEFVDMTAGKAESVYDNATRDFDKFDGHFTGEFEKFDTVDVADSVSFAGSPVAGLDVAVELSKPEAAEAKFGDAYAVTAKYALNAATFAAGYEKADLGEDKEADAWKIGAGYDFADLGVQGLTAGLTYEDAEENKNTTETLGFTAAYDVTADITVIAGYANSEFKADGASESKEHNLARFAVDYAIADNVTATAGFAHIAKDKGENNEFMHTVGMKYTF